MQRHVSWCVTVEKQIKVKITETEQREEQRRKQQRESKNFKLLLFCFSLIYRYNFTFIGKTCITVAKFKTKRNYISILQIGSILHGRERIDEFKCLNEKLDQCKDMFRGVLLLKNKSR